MTPIRPVVIFFQSSAPKSAHNQVVTQEWTTLCMDLWWRPLLSLMPALLRTTTDMEFSKNGGGSLTIPREKKHMSFYSKPDTNSLLTRILV